MDTGQIIWEWELNFDFLREFLLTQINFLMHLIL